MADLKVCGNPSRLGCGQSKDVSKYSKVGRNLSGICKSCEIKEASISIQCVKCNKNRHVKYFKYDITICNSCTISSRICYYKGNGCNRLLSISNFNKHSTGYLRLCKDCDKGPSRRCTKCLTTGVENFNIISEYPIIYSTICKDCETKKYIDILKTIKDDIKCTKCLLLLPKESYLFLGNRLSKVCIVCTVSQEQLIYECAKCKQSLNSNMFNISSSKVDSTCKLCKDVDNKMIKCSSCRCNRPASMFADFQVTCITCRERRKK